MEFEKKVETELLKYISGMESIPRWNLREIECLHRTFKNYLCAKDMMRSSAREQEYDSARYWEIKKKAYWEVFADLVRAHGIHYESTTDERGYKKTAKFQTIQNRINKIRRSKKQR